MKETHTTESGKTAFRLERDSPQPFKLSPRAKKIIKAAAILWFLLCLHGVYCEVMIERV
jgi:hypothetical protein